MMSSRERVEAALSHREGDRVPLDLGATSCSGIHVSSLYALRQALGLDEPGTPVRVCEPFQMLGEVTPDLLDRLGIDAVRVGLPNNIYGFANDDWKPWTTSDGTPVLVPGQFPTEPELNGDLYMYPKGDRSAPPCARMPASGFYFDSITRQEPIDEDHLDPADNLEEFAPVDDEALEHVRREATRLGATGRALIGEFGGTSFGDAAFVPGPTLAHPRGIRDLEQWYMSLANRPEYVKEVFERQCEIGLSNLQRIHAVVGDSLSAVFITGTDFGTQGGPMIGPKTYRALFQPVHAADQRLDPRPYLVEDLHPLLRFDLAPARRHCRCRFRRAEPRADFGRRHDAPGPEGPIRGPDHLLGRWHRHPARASVRDAGRRARHGQRAPADLRRRRRFRVQHDPQRSGACPGRERGRFVRGRGRIPRLPVRGYGGALFSYREVMRMGQLEELRAAVVDGQKTTAVAKVTEALAAGLAPEKILQEGLIAAMGETGALYQAGEIFVPEMLVAARAMSAALAVLKPHLVAEGVPSRGKVVIGTVQGDLHDIGKNLVAMFLEGNGFEVVDLGVDVPPERFVAEVVNGAKAVALSALLTTTMVNMCDVISALVDANLREQVRVLVGGAPITTEYANEIGADGYARDASSAVELLCQLLEV